MLWSAHSASLSAEPSPFLLLSITVLQPRVGGEALSHTWMHTHTHGERKHHSALTDTDADRCTKCATQLTHAHLSQVGSQKNNFCVCVWECTVGVCPQAVCAPDFKTLRAKNHPERSFFFSFFFLWAHHVTQPTPAYIDSVSQTSTTYLPAATLLLPTPSSLHPPPKPHQRHRTRQA